MVSQNKTEIHILESNTMHGDLGLFNQGLTLVKTDLREFPCSFIMLRLQVTSSKQSLPGTRSAGF